MKPTHFAFLLLCSAPFSFTQSNPVTTVNRSTTITPPAIASTPDPKAQAGILDTFVKLPLSFEANQGQTDARVKFLSRTGGYTLFLTGDGAVFSRRGGRVLSMELVKPSHGSETIGTDQLPGRSNYFIGNDPTKWHGSVPTYRKVEYKRIYPNVDLAFYGTEGRLEYDFLLAPGADPASIQFQISGANSVSRNRHGDLVLQAGKETLTWNKPTVYQQRDGVRTTVEGRYVFQRDRRVGFRLGSYDHSRQVIIDPALGFSTYLGGSSTDVAAALTVDGSGNVYVAGYTYSVDFPVTSGAYQTSCRNVCSGGGYDAFVTKLNSTGSALDYSTYVGGSSNSSSAGLAGIAVDASGNAYIAGTTFAADFPVTPGAFQTTCSACSSGSGSGFVTSLNPTGSALNYSTFLGGSSGGGASSIKLDASDFAYVVGGTDSPDFPVTSGAFQTTFKGSSDAFVSKINTTGSELVYSTLLGGTDENFGQAGVVDSVGEIFVTGYTNADDFPTTPGAFQTTSLTGSAFITKLNATGSALVYSTYLGTAGPLFGSTNSSSIAIDSFGDAYVAGETESPDFPTTAGAFQSTCVGGNNCAFVSELDASGGGLVYSTFLGGSGPDNAQSIVVGSSGNAYVTGNTSSSDFPVTPAAFDTTCANCGPNGAAAFVTELNPTGTGLIYSTYLGNPSGDSYDSGDAVALDSFGDIFVAGSAYPGFPTTPGAFQTTCGGGCGAGQVDAFVTKFVAGDQVWPLALSFGNEAVGSSSVPQTVTFSNSGQISLSISRVAITGQNLSDFSQTNTCGASLAAGSTCAITVTFIPTAAGSRSASVTITDNASNSPQSVSLTGKGTTPSVSLSPTSLTFGTQVVFTTSAAKTVTLTNTGLALLSITKVSVTGSFTQTNTCGSSVAAGASCKFTVKFKPTTSGTLTGSISITDNASGSPQNIALTGTGTDIQFSPKSLNFGNQPVGTKSSPKKITMSNKASVSVSIRSVSITGTNKGDFSETNTCGSTLKAGANCAITVTFIPSADGKRTASASVSDNGGGSPQIVSLSGTGTGS